LTAEKMTPSQNEQARFPIEIQSDAFAAKNKKRQPAIRGNK
jgi:hypothetical protein